MDCEDFEMHKKALLRIEAIETLRELKVADHPHSKQQPREEFARKVSKVANPPHEQKVYSFDEIENLFR